MPIALIDANQSIGKVVHFRLASGLEAIDRVAGVVALGGVVTFQSGRAELISNIDWLRPLTPVDAAQVFVDKNAAQGSKHDPASLYPTAGTLAGLFPTEIKDENEALRLMLSRTPSPPPAT